MRKKLRQKKGETLIESLVSLLIAVLSMMLLTSAVLAATNINRQLREEDEAYRQELQRAEGHQGEAKEQELLVEFYTEDGRSLIEEFVVEVFVYGSEDSKFLSYEYTIEE